MLISTTWATYGVDVSQAVSEADFHCLKSTFELFKSKTYVLHHFHIGNGYSFAVVRVYQEVGHVDPNGAQTIKNAHAAGIEYVDGYIFPCLRCGNPAEQVLHSCFSFEVISEFSEILLGYKHSRSSSTKWCKFWYALVRY
jgi:hypothetical protein